MRCFTWTARFMGGSNVEKGSISPARICVGTFDVYSRKRARRPHFVSILNAFAPLLIKLPHACLRSQFVCLRSSASPFGYPANSACSCRSLGYLYAWCCALLDLSLHIYFVFLAIF